MTEYQKTYIELKKQFVATNEGPDSVRALYTFKEELGKGLSVILGVFRDVCLAVLSI